MSDEIDARYREASARDAGAPAESTRRAILGAAAALAAQRAATDAAAPRRDRPTGSWRVRWWRPAVFGTLAAATLAGLVVVPQFLHPALPQDEELPRVAAEAPSIPQPHSATRPTSSAPTAAPAVADTIAAGHLYAQGKPVNSAVAALAAAGTAPSLLAQSGDINVRDSAGRTALLKAVLRGDEAGVTELLIRGADPNLAATDGTTPLQAALAGDRAAIADALRRAGAR